MAADDLAPCVTRTSAAMVFGIQHKWVLVFCEDSMRKDFNYPHHFNPQHAGTKLSRFNWVNIMAADALAPYVTRTSAAMILTV